MGRGASGRGEDRTSLMARLRYFFPMYPLGHNVSEINSMGMTSGLALALLALEKDEKVEEESFLVTIPLIDCIMMA